MGGPSQPRHLERCPAGQGTGAPIAGEDFYQALLRIWLGPQPVQDDLKKALLGG
jgi:hypothetical protein